MATIYAEAIMAQKYKQVGSDGEVTGGPVYYIRAAFQVKTMLFNVSIAYPPFLFLLEIPISLLDTSMINYYQRFCNGILHFF